MADLQYDPSEFPPFAVTVDIVVLTIRDGELKVLTITRGQEPYAGLMALPGGFVKIDEDLDSAASRELLEETNIGGGRRLHLEQLGTYGSVGRDPRMRVVSVAYVAFAAGLEDPVASTDAARAQWTSAAEVASAAMSFDHSQIFADGLERVRAKLEYTTLATAFCQPEFTIGELRSVYEAMWGTDIDPRNFNRKVLASEGFVEPTNQKTNRGGGRPAQLFKPGPATDLHPPLVR